MSSHYIKSPSAYQYAIGTVNFVKPGVRSVANGNVEAAMIDVVAMKDIGNQFQE